MPNNKEKMIKMVKSGLELGQDLDSLLSILWDSAETEGQQKETEFRKALAV